MTWNEPDVPKMNVVLVGGVKEVGAELTVNVAEAVPPLLVFPAVTAPVVLG